MPHINLKIYSGRSTEFKENLARKLQECLVKEAGCWKKSDISVSVEELDAESFQSVTKGSFNVEQLIIPSDHIW